MSRRRTAYLAATALFFATGCYRSAELSPAAVTALSSTTHPPQHTVVVSTTGGERRRLETFDALIVERRACKGPSCPEEVVKFVPPLKVEQFEGGLWVVDEKREVTFETGSIERVTVRKLAPDRTAIVVGVALAVGIAAGYLTYRAVGGCEDGSSDEDHVGFGCGAFFLAMPVAGAAGSLSLAVTLPLTKPLGSRVE